VRSAESADGFTILEVMVALTLLAFVMMALAPVFYAGMATASATSTRTEAAALATRDLEAMRSVPYTLVGFYGDQTGYVSAFEGSETVQLALLTPVNTTPAFLPLTTENFAHRTFTVRRHIVWVDAKETGGVTRTQAYKRTDVLISWTNQSGTHEIRDSSIVYPGGRGAYTGPKNNGTAVTTPSVVAPPGAPTLNTAVPPAAPAGYTEVDLAWSAPSAGGPVDHYKVQWANDNAFAGGLQSTSNIPAGNLSYPVTTLTSNQTYYFRVYAYGGDGSQSAASNTLSATTATPPVASCTVNSLNLTTSVSSSTTKTYLTANTGQPSGRNLMTENLSFSLGVTGTCGGGYRVYAKDSSNVADPGSPWNLTGSGTSFSGTALTQGNSGWSAGSHTFTVYDGTTPTSATHTLLVCAYKAVSSRSSLANQC
jgi:prepilin-type N-terminal cleavage/methylation domain-containing protein